MKATVEVMNRIRGMVGARTENGDYVVFELSGSCDAEIGDVISHPRLDVLGAERFRNVTQKIDIDVVVQNVVATLDQAKRQCFLEP